MNLERNAIEIIKTFQGNEPYLVGYSGGKDSDVVLHLVRKCGANYEAIHNLTTVDAPETVYHVRKQLDVTIIKPRISMWRLIEEVGMPPTRRARYCCKEFKEQSGIGRKLITGVRWAESHSRSEKHGIVTFPEPSKEIVQKANELIQNEEEKFPLFLNNEVKRTRQGGVSILNMDNSELRRVVENCYRTSKTLVNPIIDWDDEYLWWYIKHEKIEVNPLYHQGFCRCGCIGCAMAGKGRWHQFDRYPAYKRAYIRAFDRMIMERKRKQLPVSDLWKTGYDVFLWWMEVDNNSDQMTIEDLYGDNF